MYDEYHKYGLLPINGGRQYVKCHDECCKSGGFPPQWRQEREEEDEGGLG